MRAHSLAPPEDGHIVTQPHASLGSSVARSLSPIIYYILEEPTEQPHDTLAMEYLAHPQPRQSDQQHSGGPFVMIFNILFCSPSAKNVLFLSPTPPVKLKALRETIVTSSPPPPIDTLLPQAEKPPSLSPR